MFPVIGFTDNMSLDKALGSSKHVDEKRLNVDLAIIRQMQKNDDIEVNWKEGAKQIRLLKLQAMLMDFLKC